MADDMTDRLYGEYARAMNEPEPRGEQTDGRKRGETMITRMTAAQWEAEAIRRFGNDPLKWRFVCPLCGHEQAVEDFRPYEDKGATPDSARCVCIGRYAGVGKGPRPKPCDYTAGGLIHLAPLRITSDDRPNDLMAFDFAPVPSNEAESGAER